MSSSRQLPEKHNPLLEPAHSPQLEILVERRRLGHTDLTVKPGTALGSSAAAVGKFDYAHLRAPLPKDLKGSEIFHLKNGLWPEAYFLMRRSSDGYISATGMFKAAYPWATMAEETAERKYHKNLPSAGHEEVAGNVWISPEEALDLADEYDMRLWIVALLDPEPMQQGTKGNQTVVATPPKFIVPERTAAPSTLRASRRTRDLRSASPTKAASTPARKIATPRKPRTSRKKKDSDVPHLENGTQESIGGSVEPESVNGDAPAPAVQKPETVTVTVEQETAELNGVETKETHVRVEMPAGHPDLPLPEDPQAMIETAKKMVEEANELENKRTNAVKSLKRKTDAIEDDDEGENKLSIQPVKKVRTLEEEVARRRVQTKAFAGVAAITFLGAAVTYFL